MQQAGRKAITVAGDVRDEGHCTTLVRRAVTQIEDLTAEERDRTFRTNIYSMFI